MGLPLLGVKGQVTFTWIYVLFQSERVPHRMTFFEVCGIDLCTVTLLYRGGSVATNPSPVATHHRVDNY
eukprot:1195675-Prorocentrum_minimum.AAC.10